MGTGIDHTVAFKIVGLVLAVAPGVEGELQDLHARVAGLLQQLVDLRRQKAQVLGDDRPIPDRILQGPEEIHAGSRHPGPVHGRVLLRGDLIVGLEPAEMIDPDRVIEKEGMLHPGLPPGEIFRPVPVPVIDGIAPELAGRREGIRRAARHDRGPALLIQLEEVRMAPGVRAVHGHIDGQVSDDPDIVAGRIALEGLPLAEEHILHEAVEPHLVQELSVPLADGLRPAQADVLVPVHPGRVLKMALEGAVEGIVVQPFLVVCYVGLKSIPVVVIGLALPPVVRPESIGTVLIGPVQEQVAALVDPVIVHVGRVCAEIKLFRLLPGQIAEPDQLFQIDKIGISRKSGKGLIGGIPVSGLAQRQDLPPALSGLCQKIYKTIGFRGKTADPVFGRKA